MEVRLMNTNTIAQSGKRPLWAVLGMVAVLCGGCAGMAANNSVQVSVSGSVTTSGIAGIAAHIHDGAPGKNGPVIVPMAKTADNTWSIAAGAKFTDAQYEAFKAGNLYVNVHSAANKGGEIRGQLKP
jgi:hypothetical protein